MSAEVSFFHDRLSRYLIDDVAVRVLEAEVRDTAFEAVARMSPSPLAAVVISEVLVGNALLAGHIKGDERLTFQLLGNGALGMVMADCTATGELRARVQFPSVPGTGATLEERIRRGLGQGTLQVIKSTPTRELYRGAISYHHPTVAEAVEAYLNTSEQVASQVVMASLLEAERVTQARGLLIQALGGGEREQFESLRRGWDLSALSLALRSGQTVQNILEGLFPGHRVREVEARPLRFRCRCSEERVLSMLLSLGKSELEDMLTADGKADITCEFCYAQYHVSGAQLAALIRLTEKSDS